MLIPDKFIRAACLTLFSNIGVPVYDKEIPKSVVPIPAQRILLGSQTKVQDKTSKCGHQWKATIVFDIISEQQNGFVNTATVDDIEQSINDVIDVPGDIAIPPFTVYDTQIIGTRDMNLSTPTTTISRRLLTVEFKLGLYSTT